MEDLKTQFENHNHDGNNSKKIDQIIMVSKSLEGTASATAANYGVIFVATRPCVVKAISESHTVAGSDAGAVTLNIERLSSGSALDAGTELLSSSFSLKTTANTPQRGNLIRTPTGLNTGDRLALKDGGTLTAVAGVVVTIELLFN